MPNTQIPVNPLEMPDEDFLKLNNPPDTETTGDAETGDGKNNDDTVGSGENTDTDVTQEGTDVAEGNGTDEGGEGEDDKRSSDSPGETGTGDDNLSTKEKSQETFSGKTTTNTKTSVTKNDADKSGEGDGTQEADNPTGSKSDDQKAAPTDYKAFYEKVMAPLKANGKTIELRNPEEAIQLMQMGANYTRKMQALAPHRKMLLMLENNGLLDEGKLSYLIDLDKKNPAAIKKLIKDAGLDPLEIDLDDPQAKPYLEGNHRVSDEEASFRTVLDELSSNPEGKVTLQVIHTQWDQASKEVLWKQPDVMSLIHQQRENGIYDRITTELERQRSLGQIPPNVPFLHAYKAIGDQLAAAGGFDDLVNSATPQPQQPAPATPVATTVAKPKPAATNSDKVSAASPTRSTPRKAETTPNPLALPDDEFMKQVEQFQGRL